MIGQFTFCSFRSVYITELNCPFTVLFVCFDDMVDKLSL